MLPSWIRVEELQAAVGVLLGDGDHETQVGLDHFLLGIARRRFAFVHALVDVLQLRERHHHARLDVGQALLQFLHRRNVAREHGAPGLAGGGLLLDPLQVQEVRGDAVAVLVVAAEVADELVLREAALVHDDAAQLALLLANVVHLRAHQVAQLLDGLGREADGHQLFGQGLLGLGVRGRAVAFLVVDLVDLLEHAGDAVEALERFALEFLELLGERLGAALAVVVVFFVEFVEVFFGHVVVGLVGVREAVHDGRDDDLAFADRRGQAQDLGDGGGGGRDGFHHGHQAAFDALGDFDFAFARQQLDRAHFAHVHAHGVGGAAEFAVHRGERGFGFFLGFFHRGGGGRGVVQEERFGVGRLLVHRHAHVVQHGDHDFHGLGVDQLVGQVVGDFAVREVAAGLAQRDQGLQARAALGQVFFGEHGLVEAELLHQGAFLRLADLHAQRLDLFFGGRGDRRLVAGQVFLDVRQVDVALGGVVAGLGLAAALGAGGRCGGTGGLGRTADFLGSGSGDFLGIVEGGRFRGHGFHFRCGCRFGRGGTRLRCRRLAGFQRFLCYRLFGDAFGE
jgi:hypothetical protein